MFFLSEKFKPSQDLKAINNLEMLKGLTENLASREILDEMAVPAYFKGNFLSRQVFWGRLNRFLQPLDIPSGSSILDFGCGIGLLAPYIAAKESSYCGIDLTPETAKQYALKLGLKHAEFYHSLSALKPKQRFDAIISFDVLEHVEDLSGIFEQFSALLNPGGLIAISGPTENMLYRLGRRIVGFSGEYHCRNIYDIFQAANRSGFTMEYRRTWPLPAPLTLFECGYYRNKG